MSNKHIANARQFAIAMLRGRLIAALSLMLVAFPAFAIDPDVSIDDPTPSTVFLGENTVLPILVGNPSSTGSITNLSATFGQSAAERQYQIVDSDCPGYFSSTITPNVYLWLEMPDLGPLESINCQVELKPLLTGAVVVPLSVNCGNCGGSNYLDIAQYTAAYAADVQGQIITDQFPGASASGSILLRIENIGDGLAGSVDVAFFGSTDIFASLQHDQSGGDCLQGVDIIDYSQDFESATWSLFADMGAGEVLECRFDYTAPASGEHALNLSITARSGDTGLPDRDPDNNVDSVSVAPGGLTVNIRTADRPDINPGDGVCADENGDCGLATAVQEANALAGVQTVLVPYDPLGYFLTGSGTDGLGDAALVLSGGTNLEGIPDPISGALPIITNFSAGAAYRLVKVENTGGSTTIRNLHLRNDPSRTRNLSGAVLRNEASVLELKNVMVSGGRTSEWGGGIYHRGEYLRLIDVEIFDNEADLGGGVAMDVAVGEGYPILQRVSIHDNHATYGGGLYAFQSNPIEIRESSFVTNQADEFGGGLDIATGASVAMANSTISGNTAGLKGGGIYFSDNSFQNYISYSTIVDNHAGPGDSSVGDGGGIYGSSLSASITPLQIDNSIVANNTARSSGSPIGFGIGANCYGKVYSQGYNTFLSYPATDTDCLFQEQATDTLTTSPSLAPLATTGFGNRGYHALRRVNNEVDGANPNCTVQTDIIHAFVHRPLDGDVDGEARCDRGAVEMSPQQVTVTTSLSGPAQWRIETAEADVCGLETCHFPFPIGATATLTAIVEPGSSFAGWGGDCSGTGDCVLQMSEPRNVTASFSTTDKHLDVSVSGNGTVTSSPAGIDCGAVCGANFADGTSVTLTAAPEPGYVFNGWTGCSSTNGSICRVLMDQQREVAATFVETFAMSVSVIGNGSVTSSPAGIACPGDCSEDYADGVEVTLTPTPDPGFDFDHWSGGCSGSGACVVQIDQTRNITAHFVANTTAIYANGFE
ncbi:MAG: hypothetical protein R3F01_11040 [Lysobacteraceae bacterium]